jgi:Kef-type K+ transport system membrane component KefB
MLAEFYANFGVIGCIFGMFFVGCILRIISTPIVNDKKNNIDGNLISISIFFQFIYQEINLTLILGNILIHLVLTTIIIFITNKIFKT